LPNFRFSKVLGAARSVISPADTQQPADQTENLIKNTRQRISELRGQIKSKRQEVLRQKRELHPGSEKAERARFKKSKKRAQQETFQLRRQLRAAQRLRKELRTSRQRADSAHDRPVPQVAAEPETGALPDFVVIGGKKCGTTFFYHLLTQHPHVEPAASKELHYFDALFDEETVEWYRRCFPVPKWENGRRTITGEATPYIASRHAPERMAKVVPRARLISLLRNPIDRAYSDYQQVVRKGREPRTFEEAVEDETSEYLSRSVYVDQLLRWSEFFPREQMLVLKSEDFFERPTETLSRVLDFLDLPGWQPEEAEVRNRGTYTENMDPATRRRLEEYFEPHNRRLYEYLGADLGW
jgi:Sulfotransferase domain